MLSRNNEYAFEQGAIDGKTVTNSASTVLPANPGRRYAALVNTGAADVFLALGTTAQAGKGVCLRAGGGAFELHALNLYHGAISAITAAGSSTLSIQEGF